ncbi:Ig-like domain-containing protein [Clostridium beijerinckii]|uniref:Ig-like domain-containing protein n=2 Tax=Clostridium beijerinckii TaxID=1520 RepID=UPI00098C5DDA|nr:Ig-like domain-containing protein [Clostridium beijerinckii]MBA8937776.1 uncharacterized protein YjdB [Clostridium beijerinckii]NRU41608.1 uncharacterized protein YjdB [Clostridium beijerinckii]NRU41667.1 uncharacterized protein YjdB [Clostridium beijerinckii]NSB00848.1 uncharacterized protein YjdB [Clostridium beijerinckii]OOM65766.1 bacterial Ig-like domain protein [Clostridium beijerinckii]
MKNYFKKFSIIFIMLLSIIGVGAMENATQVNAATIGQQLALPETGWRRYDDSDSKIQYIGTNWNSYLSGTWGYNGSSHDGIETIKFKFYGTKFRVIGATNPYGSSDIDINIDGTTYNYSANANLVYNALNFEKTGLPLEIHTVTIVDNTNNSMWLDAIDLDETGYLVEYINMNESILLDRSTLDLNISTSKQLIATTTPAGAQVTWKSSDESVATVDENGNVTGVKEGQATITATINDGSNISATCTVNVVPKTTEPTEPQDPTGDGTLFIELVDGNIKSYDVSSQEITNFINWYKNRDLDDSQSPVYKFKKGDYTDYVVHDKIDWFEVR